MGRALLAVLWTLAAASHAEASPHNPDHKVSLGAYYANFDNSFGDWGGGHLRAWLLDVTGERSWQGFVEVVDLHWRPDGPTDFGDADSEYLMARLMHNWNEDFYTFFTASGSIGDLVYPRVHGEAEMNYIVADHRNLVLTFGVGYRNFDGIHRPYVLAGLAYSLPKASVSYRLYSGAGMAEHLSYSHLFTLVYGERLDFWLRLELLFGEEAHPGSGIPRFLGGEVESRAATLHWDHWIRDNFGITTRLRLSEGRLELAYANVGDPRTFVDEVFRYWQLEIRPFLTF